MHCTHTCGLQALCEICTYLESQAELEQLLIAGCPVAVDLGVVRISLHGLVIVLYGIRESSYTHTCTHVHTRTYGYTWHTGTHTHTGEGRGEKELQEELLCVVELCPLEKLKGEIEEKGQNT